MSRLALTIPFLILQPAPHCCAGLDQPVLNSVSLSPVPTSLCYSVLHIIQAYNVSADPTREGRTQQALRRLGGAVISGSFANMICSAPLFSASFALFYRFGFVQLTTAIVSIVWAVCVLPSALLVAGPLVSWLSLCCF